MVPPQQTLRLIIIYLFVQMYYSVYSFARDATSQSSPYWWPTVNLWSSAGTYGALIVLVRLSTQHIGCFIGISKITLQRITSPHSFSWSLPHLTRLVTSRSQGLGTSKVRTGNPVRHGPTLRSHLSMYLGRFLFTLDG